MAWWTENLTQGQRLIVNKALLDIEHTPKGATVWVQGCAGTGKTLVLAHIARELALKRKDRNIAFLTYTHSLKEMIDITIANSPTSVYISTYKAFLYRRKPIEQYEIILIDEIQDISKEELIKLKNSCLHLIVAGDCEQRIYDQGTTEEEIDGLISFNKTRLVELFRVTESIIKWARNIIPSTKLFSGEIQKEKDTDIGLRRFKNEQEEAKWVYDEALAFARPEYPSAILFPTHRGIYEFCSLIFDLNSSSHKIDIIGDSGKERIKNYNQLNSFFDKCNISLGYLGNGVGDLSQSDNRPFVYIMTYHSAKGLDFQSVFLPRLGLDSGVYFGPNPDRARALFFVGVTRARERLLATYSGNRPYHLLETIPNFSNRIVDHNANDHDDKEEWDF